MQFFTFDRHDTYEWFLGLGPLSTANARYFNGKLPTWNDFVHHPNYDDSGAGRRSRASLAEPEGPDAERRRLVGPGRLLRPAQDLRDVGEEDPERQNVLVVGPWNHGGWQRRRATAWARSSSASAVPREDPGRSSRTSRTGARSGVCGPISKDRGSAGRFPKCSASAPGPTRGSPTTAGRPARRPARLYARERPAGLRAAARRRE